MNESILIESIKVCRSRTPEQIQALLKDMEQTDSKELVLFPDKERANLYIGVLLEKYHTPPLTACASIRDSKTDGTFRFLTLSHVGMRTYLSVLTRRLGAASPIQIDSTEAAAVEIEEDSLIIPDDEDPMRAFLMHNTPLQIQRKLDEMVIGQPELTAAVADFLYYHALRQQHPQLPQRPLLIAGPSGSGKTEVWRAAAKLYGDLFQIQIVDGSNMTCDGWAGNYKLSTFVTTKFAKGGILVVDEFDKLVTPKHASGGDNVAMQMQSEFLKLFEGEHQITEYKRTTNITSKAMGFVLVGAFEELRQQKSRAKSRQAIGFRSQVSSVQAISAEAPGLTDDDFIAFGIMPEIVGRIAVKCTTRPLETDTYLEILRGPHSRVTMLSQVLAQYGIHADEVISQEELRDMIAHSRSNRTGVRWVCAQVENHLLDAIRERGLFPGAPAPIPLREPLKRCS